MYPKNAASPEKIAIGAVVQISDGAVQTSGCTVRILTSGDAEGDGGGTTAYSTDGIVLYTPTQVESNHASFILIAKKTGCIPASITVVPTLSATPGQAVCADTQKVDVETIKTQAVTCASPTTVPTSIASPTNITAGTIATVTNLTNLPTIPNDWIAAAGVKADAVTKIQTGLATPTNITAGTITTVTNLTNAPTNGDLTATMKTSAQTAANAALVANNLDHFMKTPVSDITKLGDSGGNEVPDSTVLSLMLCKGTDTDTYSHTTDSMEAVRDKLPTNLEDMSITDTTGIVKADLVSILAYTLTETGGYLAAAFKKLFNVATPVLTCESVNQTIDNPTAAAIGTDAASKVLVTPAQKIVTDGSGFVTYANAAPPAASAIKTAIEASGSHLALIKAVTDKVDTIVEVVP